MWVHKNTFAVGGLENIGYAPDQDFLLVLSSQGQGIFNCTTGEKVARSYDDSDWFNQLGKADNSILGFDILASIKISTCGAYGEDNLSKRTKDGWALIVSDPEPDDAPFEKYMVRKIYLLSPDMEEKVFITSDGPCELRAFGFSETGETFVVGLSCDLVIYSRI